MDKYDIGILTFWNVPNYGTFAQAYALQKTLEKLFPERDVKQIAHLDEYHYNFYYNKLGNCRFGSRSYFREILRGLLYKKEKDGKKELFLNAYNQIPHTKELSLKNVKEMSFKNIVLGSDIIWDYSIGAFNNDRMLFGKDINTKHVGAYAASFGTVEIDVCIPEDIQILIKNMSNIAVRDEKSAVIVEKITGTKPKVVLDPVWLWDFRNDENIVGPQLDDYIVAYGQDFTPEFIENLVAYAKEKGLKIVALDCNDDEYEWCDILVKQKDLTPFQWMGYFMGATCVATSTFHGLTFGLVFQKKIAFCKTEFILAKIDVFLKKIGIYDLFSDPSDVKKMLDYSWNYVEINRYVEQERVKSYEFLLEVCGKTDEY